MARRRNKTSNYLSPVWAAVVCAILALAVAGLGLWLQPRELRIAISKNAPEDIAAIEATSRRFAQNKGDIRLRLVEAEGEQPALELLATGNVDLAVARSDRSIPSGARAVAIVRRNVAVLIADGSRIKSSKELAAKRVGVLSQDPADLEMANAVLASVNANNAGASAIPANAEQPRDRSFDAYIAIGALNSKRLTQLLTLVPPRAGLKVIEIESAEAIAGRKPVYEALEIPAGAIEGFGPAEKIDTLGVSTTLWAPASMPDRVANALVHALFDARSEMADGARLDPPNTDKNAPFKVHPGAMSYYDGTERTFLEQYSDYLWASLLAASFGFSGWGWLRRKWRGTAGSELSHIARMAAAMKQALAADGITEMRKAQAEADAILLAAAAEMDAGGIDGGEFAAVNALFARIQDLTDASSHASKRRKAPAAPAKSKD